MGHYETQVVCKNGHQISDAMGRAERPVQFCNICGAPGISQCPGCRTPIPGYYRADGVIDLRSRRTTIPRHCGKCGAPFPWKEALEAREAASRTTLTLDRIERLLRRFPQIARQLRARHDDRPTLSVSDEYDVQDLLLALLRLDCDDIRKEEWTPSYAGKSARMDLLVKPLGLVIEAKMTRKGLADRDLGDQLIVDIARYRNHPECKTLLCFVFDPDGFVRNPAGIAADLATAPSPPVVKVIVAPDS